MSTFAEHTGDVAQPLAKILLPTLLEMSASGNKVMTAYENFIDFGADWEQFANGGGRDASTDIFNDVDECDDARVYVARSLRSAQLR